MDIIDINTMFGPLPIAAVDLSVDDLSALMKKHGIERACTLSTVGLMLDHNAGNAATRAACAENPSLVPVATVNPQVYYGEEGPFTRFATDGFRMVRFFPQVQGWPVDYAPFVHLAQRLEAERLPIMMEISHPGTATRLMNVLAGRQTPVLLAGIDEQTLAEAVILMRQHANVYVETSSLLATGVIKHVVDCVGAERVLYGSGAPSRPMASGLGVLRYVELTDMQRALVLGGNARRLLGI